MPFIITKPAYRAVIQGTTIELWVSQRKLPMLLTAGAMIVPVAPDLKMVFGVAKIARDYGANAIQYEANQSAPLAPGQAFVGSGAKFRYQHTALAVIFDEAKRVTPQLIAQAVRNALQQLRLEDVDSVIFPDITENLMAQPNWITQEQRRNTAQIAARIMLDTVVACDGLIPTVKFWSWDPNNVGIFINEMKKMEQEDLDARVRDLLPNGAEDDLERPYIKYGPTAEFKTTAVQVAFGDPLLVESDAIFRATNTNLERERLEPASSGGGGGTAVATKPSVRAKTFAARLIQLGGPKLVEELKAAGIPALGDATITRAGALTQTDYILHLAVRPSTIPATEQAIYSAVQAGLELADEYGLKTVVIPNVGAGDNDYPVELAVTLTLNAIQDYLGVLGRHSSLAHIVLVTEEPGEEQAYRRAIAHYLPPIIPLPKPIVHEHE